MRARTVTAESRSVAAVRLYPGSRPTPMLTIVLTTALLALQTPAEEWGERAWASAVDSLRNGEDWGHHYEAAKATCPACGEGFQVASAGTYTTSGKDLDFKISNYVSANPY